jgi:hypothetical protein
MQAKYHEPLGHADSDEETRNIRQCLSIHQSSRLNRLPRIRAAIPTPIQIRFTLADGHA